MTHSLMMQATADIASVTNADEAILFVTPWADPMNGEGLRSAICRPSALSIVEDGRFGPEIHVADETLVVDLGQDGHFYHDAYLILPRERLVGDDLAKAIADIREVLAAISEENAGRCGHRWDRYDNHEVPTSEIVVGDEIVLPEERFRASDLLRVYPFLMKDDAGREESSVEMFFADGRAARLRGGFDWFNHCC